MQEIYIKILHSTKIQGLVRMVLHMKSITYTHHVIIQPLNDFSLKYDSAVTSILVNIKLTNESMGKFSARQLIEESVTKA